MKQKDLAKKAKITESMVSQMLAGKKAPSDDLALILESFTGIHRYKWINKKVTKKTFRDHFLSGRRISRKNKESNELTPEVSVNE